MCRTRGKWAQNLSIFSPRACASLARPPSQSSNTSQAGRPSMVRMRRGSASVTTPCFEGSRLNPPPYAYGGGFSRDPSKHGVVTDADPRLIRTIDGRPAWDVFDDWLGGRAKEAQARGEKMLKFCAHFPLVRHITKNGVSQDQFTHVHPSDTVPGALTAE